MVSLVIDVLILLVLAALVRAVIGLGYEVWLAMFESSTDSFKTITTQILTVVIFIEIFHSLVDYLRQGRVRVTYLVDASLAFVLREVWVDLYAGDGGWARVVALAALVLALGVVRTLAIRNSPAEGPPAAAED